jgi:hypothetical protein
MKSRLALTILALAAGIAPAQNVLPPFSSAWSAVDLGQVPGRSNYGGIAFPPGQPDVLLYGEYSSGRIVAVPLLRDAQGRIRGFGTPRDHAQVGGPDGGLAFGPGGVLFATEFGAHALHQLRPGSAVVDRTIALDALGIPSSVGACAFPPAGHPAAGRLKLLSYSNSSWSDARLSPDGAGTFSLATVAAPIQLSGGPEGALYPPTGLPMFADHATVLVAEWSSGEIVRYDTDVHGDPLPGTRQPLVGNVPSCGGGAVDPVSGDMLFTFGAGHLLAVRNTASPCGSMRGYGLGTPGLNGVPSLQGQGCARLGQTISLVVGSGRPGAAGVLNFGLWQTDIPAFGLRVLTFPDASVAHLLDASGGFAWSLRLPADPAIAAHDFYLQAIYFDPAAVQGFAATRGLALDVN